MAGTLTQARSIVEHLPDAAILFAPDARPLACSGAFTMLTGVRRRALRKILEGEGDILELLNASEDLRERLGQCLRSGRPLRLAEMSLYVNEEDLTVSLSFVPVTEGDTVLGAILVVRDVTAEARVQKRFKKLLDAEKARADDLEREVAKRTQDLREALAEVTRLSRTDSLTGLQNRRAFGEIAQRALNAAKRHDRCMAVFVCDMDHFKSVNDNYGHDTGDEVLVELAKTLVKCVRESDVVSRFGGEEFVVLLSETSPLHTRDIAERCRTAVHEVRERTNLPPEHKTSISIGVALYPQDGDTMDDLIAQADKALYEAKDTGRDKVVFCGDLSSESENRIASS